MTPYSVEHWPVLHRPLLLVRMQGALMHITAFAGVGYLPKAIQIAKFAGNFRVRQSLRARAVVPIVLRGSQGMRNQFHGDP
jgi:hypothetical protein